MVMQSLPSLGLEALGVAVVCAAGSCAAVWLLWMLIRKRGAPDRKSTQEESGSWKDGAVKNGGGLRAVADSIVIVAFFAAGILCGLYGLLPFDVTLPIITNTCGERYAVLSIYHGFVVDFSVPFLVTFFCVL